MDSLLDSHETAPNRRGLFFQITQEFQWEDQEISCPDFDPCLGWEALGYGNFIG